MIKEKTPTNIFYKVDLTNFRSVNFRTGEASDKDQKVFDLRMKLLYAMKKNEISFRYASLRHIWTQEDGFENGFPPHLSAGIHYPLDHSDPIFYCDSHDEDFWDFHQAKQTHFKILFSLKPSSNPHFNIAKYR